MIGQLLTGRYLILEKLGAGGFSETYLARDKYLPRHPLCVVKCLKLSSSNTLLPETALRLFENEACILERVGQNHAQIPTLFAYCNEQDLAYLVQEYIDGENLGRWLARKQRITADVAIKLLLEMLPVLDYLHTHRVIHRDLKPSNLIRRKRDGKVVLIDFGAASLLTDIETNTMPDDELPLAIGTPGYMPDEQHLGMSQLNSDLYSLGILVIHLLTRVHPREYQQDLISGELDWHRYLGEKPIEPKLVEILDQMVRVKANDRYQQASDVLADLQQLPKYARSPVTIPEWRKVMQRVAIPATAVLLMGLGGQTAYTYRQQAQTLLTQLKKQFFQPAVHLTMLHDVPTQANIERMLISPDNRLLVTAGTDHSIHLWTLPAGTPFKSLYGHTATVKAMAMSRDGKLLVSGSEDGMLRLWDTDSGQPIRAFKAHQNPVTALAISPDARSIVSGCKDGTLRQWDVQTGIRMKTLRVPHTEIAAAVYGSTPDRLISASSDRQLQVWNLNTGQLHRTFAGHTQAIVGLQVADDSTLFSFGKDRGLMWDLKREELALVLPENSANSTTVSLSNQNIVTAHENGSIRVWVRKSGRLVPQEAGDLGRNEDVALSPNHHYLVSWNSDQRLRVWQLNEKR